MTVHLVTFATENMSRARVLCVRSAKANGVEAEWVYSPVDVAAPQSERGCGFWAWKPAIILKTFALDSFVSDGDILIYADAGVGFIDNVSHIIDRMDQDVWLFGNNWEHAHWCKRDVVEAVLPFQIKTDHSELENTIPWMRFGKQVQASVIFFRVSDYSRAFVKEWLDWCLFEGGRLIDDSPSRAPNHPEFREHRHDQAVLTTLSYREGIKLHWWPARYNMDQPGGGFVYEKGEYQDDYPPLFHHHRRRNHEWPAQPSPASAIPCDATV